MPDAINQAFVNQYSTTLHMQVQQMGSRLMNTTRVEPVVGEAVYLDRLGAFTANEYADREAAGVRHQATPINDTPHSKRLVSPRDFDWGTAIDNFDKLRMLLDPLSAYNINARAALGRQMDVEILRGAVAAATDKDGNSIALPASSQINTGAGGLAIGATLVLDTILAMEEQLNTVEAEGSGRYWALNAARWRQLKAIPEVQSMDFNEKKVLAGDGSVDPFSIRFNGFQFIRTELGATPLGSADDLVWQQQGIAYGDWSDIITEIAKDPSIKYSWRPYFAMTGGATRMEEELVYTVTYAA
ncbi:MAG: phage capsid protein [Myxococcota bacterium]|nr:phage capsid protein [Myxococcota bacterium]